MSRQKEVLEPKIFKPKKVVLSVAVGKRVVAGEQTEYIAENLAIISGQKPKVTRSKKSIAGFKLRGGQVSGYQVTLRGRRMDDFLVRLKTVVLPRIRDFRGFKPSSIDQGGNLNIGLSEQLVFPELAGRDKIHPLQITIVTGLDRGLALSRLDQAGFPAVKEEA